MPAVPDVLVTDPGDGAVDRREQRLHAHADHVGALVAASAAVTAVAPVVGVLHRAEHREGDRADDRDVRQRIARVDVELVVVVASASGRGVGSVRSTTGGGVVGVVAGSVDAEPTARARASSAVGRLRFRVRRGHRLGRLTAPVRAPWRGSGRRRPPASSGSGGASVVGGAGGSSTGATAAGSGALSRRRQARQDQRRRRRSTARAAMPMATVRNASG